MAKARFEWSEKKNRENQGKHGVPFGIAQYAFADQNRIIAEDLGHSLVSREGDLFGELDFGHINSIAQVHSSTPASSPWRARV